MAASLDLRDWAEILDLNEMISGLQSGLLSPRQARELVAQRREVYPNVPLDYVRALEGMLEVVRRVERAIEAQNAQLEDLNDALWDAGMFSFGYDPTRLLQETEQGAVEGLQDDLEDAAEEAEDAEREAEDLLRELEREQEALEDEAVEQEDAIEKLESDLDELDDDDE